MARWALLVPALLAAILSACPATAAAFPLLTTAVSPACPGAAAVHPSARPPAPRKVIMVVVDRLGYPELQSGAGPFLASLFREEKIALMNARAGRAGSESGYLSLGAAARAVAGAEASQALARGETVEGQPAEVIYRRHHGRAPRGEVFHLQAPLLQEKNKQLDYYVSVGFLGERLAAAGRRAAVLGNADTNGPQRGAVTIAMNALGEVAFGDVGDTFSEADPLFPYGRRTDEEKLAAAVQAALEKADLVVADFGDFLRLDEYWPHLAAWRREQLFNATMARLDRFLQLLYPLLDGHTLLLMVVPSPPRHISAAGQFLLPLLAADGSRESGTLSSLTTRRQGLITNTDVAALVLDYLERKEMQPGGDSSVWFVGRQEVAAYLDGLYTRAVRVYLQRPLLLKGYVLAVIATVLGALGALALRLPLARKLAAVLEILMAFPVAALLLSGWARFPFSSVMLTGALLAVAAVLIALLLQPFKKKSLYHFWAALGLLTAAVIGADTLAGAPLQQSSFLGYDPIAGARFYGIGNEYMGVLLGAAVVGGTSLAGVLAAPGSRAAGSVPGLFAACSLPLIFLFASPRFGANMGGTLSAAVAMGAAFTGTRSILKDKTHPAAVLLFLLAAALMLWLFNFWWQPSLPSHLGRFGEHLSQWGWPELWRTVARKAAMNWRLIRYSIWSRALVTFLGLLVVLFYYPLGLLRKLRREKPFLTAGTAAALAGAVTALATNDSGVVAAALLLLFGVPPLLAEIIDRTVARGAAAGGEQ